MGTNINAYKALLSKVPDGSNLEAACSMLQARFLASIADSLELIVKHLQDTTQVKEWPPK